MRSVSKTRLGLYLGIIFAAGAVTGSVVAWHNAQQEGRPSSMEKVCHRMQTKLKSRLSLTDAEFDRIRPILDQSTRDLQRIHAKTVQDIDAAIRRRNEQLSPYLSSEQRLKLEEMDRQQCQNGEGAAPARELEGTRFKPRRQ